MDCLPRLVHVHGCWLAIKASSCEELERAERILEALDAEKLLYEGAPVAPDCARVYEEARAALQETQGVAVEAAWPNPR
ncbi:hypothetical protein Pyrde_1891 [Pyrodictium delaneyi]|uniref:Uncharacterized protein n=1 Tax=Pyrodictium delaneyi TaxID=1273541 RepID=A0A0P0N5V8_9CREN|nr:hypothetical protein [Pyrodictium delaneyi]ALL01934.1 hypothetical protein Pyrde_1891 [Pyrodictium delaneyi]